MSRRLGPYTLESKIADGGMAEVFLASKEGAEGWRRRVVLKRILPQYADRAEFRALFQNEAVLAISLSHANLTHIHDYFEVDETPVIVQEYLHGRDLRQLLARMGEPLSWPVVAYIGLEALKGLEYLHDAQAHPQAGAVLHRDVSPHNLVVGYDGQVKLIDLGIAQGTQATLALLQQIPGKRAYMAPEALQQQNYQESSELYSLALTLAEALLAMPAQTLRDMPPARRQELLLGRGVPATLVRLLQQCLLQDAAARPAGAGWLRTAFAEVLKDASVTAQAAQRQLVTLMQQLYPSEAEREYTPLQETAVLHTRTETAAQHGMRPWHISLGLLLFVGIWLWPSQPVSQEKPAETVLLAATHVTPLRIKHAKPSAGTLDIDSFPWSSVYLNGRFLGVTPLKQLEVPAGDYQLYMVTRDGRAVEMPLNVQAGNRRQLFRQIP